MTQSIPSQFTNDITQHKLLMELIEAEDAANGEVGCGRDLGKNLTVYLNTYGINISGENLRTLLREHLGNLLMERDFDSITTQVSRFIESKAVQANILSKHPQHLQAVTEPVVKHIAEDELKGFFQAELGEFCSEAILEQIIQFTHQVVYKAVLQPRHTWPKPIWVLKTGEKVYVAQASSLEDAIAKVKAQYPQETGILEVLTVKGVLAPDQVISLDRRMLFGNIATL